MKKLKSYFKKNFRIGWRLYWVFVVVFLFVEFFYLLVPDFNPYFFLYMFGSAAGFLLFNICFRLISIFLNTSAKKQITITTFIFLVFIFLFFLPMRCSDVEIKQYLIGDVGGLEGSQLCYSIYHKNYWSSEKQKQTQYLFGLPALSVVLTNSYGRNIDLPELRGVQQIVVRGT